MSLIANNIKYLRTKNKMSMDGLAKIIKKGKSTVKMYEDNNSTPDANTVRIIVNHFKISYYKFFETDLEHWDQITSSVNFNPGTATLDELQKEYESLSAYTEKLQHKLLTLKASLTEQIEASLK